MLGGNVCGTHGGRAPQVRAAAQMRILGMVSPALRRLQALVDNADTDSVKLSAVKDILDRAGLAVAQIHQLQGPNGAALFPVEALEAFFKSRNNTDDKYDSLP